MFSVSNHFIHRVLSYFVYHRLIKLIGSYAIIFNATIKHIYIYIYDLTSNYFYKIENNLVYARTR